MPEALAGVEVHLSGEPHHLLRGVLEAHLHRHFLVVQVLDLLGDALHFHLDQLGGARLQVGRPLGGARSGHRLRLQASDLALRVPEDLVAPLEQGLGLAQLRVDALELRREARLELRDLSLDARLQQLHGLVDGVDLRGGGLDGILSLGRHLAQAALDSSNSFLFSSESHGLGQRLLAQGLEELTVLEHRRLQDPDSLGQLERRHGLLRLVPNLLVEARPHESLQAAEGGGRVLGNLLEVPRRHRLRHSPLLAGLAGTAADGEGACGSARGQSCRRLLGRVWLAILAPSSLARGNRGGDILIHRSATTFIVVIVRGIVTFLLSPASVLKRSSSEGTSACDAKG